MYDLAMDFDLNAVGDLVRDDDGEAGGGEGRCWRGGAGTWLEMTGGAGGGGQGWGVHGGHVGKRVGEGEGGDRQAGGRKAFDLPHLSLIPPATYV